MPADSDTEVLLDTILSSLETAVLIIDAAGVVVRANAAAQHFFVGDATPAADIAQLGTYLSASEWRRLAGGARLTIHRRDGRSVPIGGRCFPCPQGTLWLLHDLTDQAMMEQEVSRLFRQAQAQADDIFALYQLSQLMGSLGSEDTQMTSILSELVRLAAADWGALLHAPSLTGDQWQVVARYAEGDGPVSPAPGQMQHAFLGETEPAPYEDIVVGTRTLDGIWGGVPLSNAGSGMIDPSDPRSLLLPLTNDERVMGLLWLHSANATGFTHRDLRLLNTLAHELTLALLSNQAHHQLQAERSKLAAIIDGASDGIIMVDGQRRIVVFNPAMEALTGRTASSAYGKSCVDVLRCRDAADRTACHDKCPFQHMFESLGSLPYRESTVVTVEGRRVPVAGSYALVQKRGQDDGELSGVAILRDVSQQKALERLQSDFIATVSHELRTPLTLIKGYTASLLHLPLDQAMQRTFATELDTTADRLSMIINDVLDVSQIDSGGFQLHREEVDIAEILRAAVAEFGQTYSERVFHLRLPAYLPHVDWDRQRIRQVLDNLLSNAVKYSPGGGSIVINGRVEDSSLLVSVMDEGVGIGREELPRLFSRFQRLSSATISHSAGSGLGLYICRHIVEAHGGRIWADSAAGRGTTVEFRIPLKGGVVPGQYDGYAISAAQGKPARTRRGSRPAARQAATRAVLAPSGSTSTTPRTDRPQG